MEINFVNNDIIVSDVSCFSLSLSLDCGQAFRWKKYGDIWQGVVCDKILSVSQDGENIIFHNTTKDNLSFWINYFDLNRDYENIVDTLSVDPYLNTACHEYYGIRILRQLPFETLCSFIISANNNIPRIKGIIERLCICFGKELTEGFYSFPSPIELAELSVEDLAPIRAGFRAKYIIDAARKTAYGEVSLDNIKTLELEDARAELMKIKGVGEKVADCTLLYGFNRLVVFPKDVWVKRVLNEMYPNGLPSIISGYEGIAQQYLFHWRRNIKTE
ncbi:MAG TPA: DNA glycosylase [Clostridia bacterium]|nr:DNA glycosylase [Clostridia bacterium]